MKTAASRLVFAGALGVGLVLTAGPAAAAGHPSEPGNGNGVWRTADWSIVEGASSAVVRTGDGLSAKLHTSGLTRGHAVTAWWVIFNRPEQCDGADGVPFRCAEPDLANPAVKGSVQYAAGQVVGENGQFGFTAHLREGDVENCPLDRLCTGLIDSDNADVALVVRSHGPELAAYMPEQIRTFEGGCTPDTSQDLGDGPNECKDLQIAVAQGRDDMTGAAPAQVEVVPTGGADTGGGASRDGDSVALIGLSAAVVAIGTALVGAARLAGRRR